MPNQFEDLPAIAAKIRKSIVDMLHSSGASHLGSNLSTVEILTAVYSLINCEKIINLETDRSRVIMSKGHAAAAHYSTLNEFGILSIDNLNTYHLANSDLTGHVNHKVPGIEHSTGALGHGINVACGCALGSKFSDLNYGVYVILGDGEMQEGSVWEAFMFAGHNRLSQLTALIDYNKISSITYTNEVISIEPLSERLSAFGWSVCAVNGHSTSEIIEAIQNTRRDNKPLAVICETTKGKGVSFAENKAIWHYRSLTDELHKQAVTEILREKVKK